MIEIKFQCDHWIAYVNGKPFDYAGNLTYLLEQLTKDADAIANMID